MIFEQRNVCSNVAIWLQMSYIAFSCPEGYIFEDSNNATNYAFCFNTTFDVQYDPKKYCVRK